MATAGACERESGNLDVVDITVRPRVVLDGTVELSDRSDGRVVIDRILAHAGQASVTATSLGNLGAVLVDDEALLFSYSPRTEGDQEAAERTWTVPADGAMLRMGFSPAESSSIVGAPFDVDGLLNHTLVVQGSIALMVDDVTGYGFGYDLDGDPDGTPARPTNGVAESDPDGTPADPGQYGESDPDGTPAKPTNGVAESDPDGTPAHPGNGDVDPDGSPADMGGALGDNDPDGTPACPDPSDNDPDGTPARKVDGKVDGKFADVDPDGSPAMDPGSIAGRGLTSDKMKSKAHHATMKGATAGRHMVRVPFTIYIDGAFDYDVAISSQEIAAIGEDQVLPIDLRFPAAALMTAERLAVLEQLANESLEDGTEDQGASLAVSATSTAPVLEVEVHTAVKREVRPSDVSGSKIVVTGPQMR